MKSLMNAVALAAVMDHRAFEYGRKDAGSGGTDDDIGALSVKLSQVMDQVKSFGEEVKGKIEKGDKVTDDLKGRTDEALTTMNDIKSRMEELEQKAARRGRAPDGGRKTTSDVVLEHDEVKSFLDRAPRKGSVKIEVKEITSAGDSAGALVRPDRQTNIVAPPDRRMTVRDLLTPGNTNSNLVEYERETGFTNNAEVVVEGALKPQSDITFELVNSPVRTIAHWVRGTRQILSDAPRLRSYIDGRLRYGLDFKEELQLLKGDGSGENLEGLITVASAYVAPFTLTGSTVIDQLRLAQLQAVLAEYPATGHVLNPIDWARIELMKDSEGRYIVGNPQGTATPTLWGLPVVATQAIDPDKFLTGAFKLGAQVFDRQDATVEISTEDQDNFVRNRVTILAEERLALAIYRPEAFVYGDFGNVPDV